MMNTNYVICYGLSAHVIGNTNMPLFESACGNNIVWYYTSIVTHDNCRLRKLYPTATEEISPSDPEPFWTGIPIKCYVDADWAGDLSMRRSVSGYIIYFGSTPIIWSSKAQSRVESSTYSSEFTALKSALEEIKGVRIALRAFGVEVSEPTIVMCDNRSVV